MFSSVSVPWPRRFLNTRCNLSVRFSNIGSLPVYREGDSRAASQRRGGACGVSGCAICLGQSAVLDSLENSDLGWGVPENCGSCALCGPLETKRCCDDA